VNDLIFVTTREYYFFIVYRVILLIMIIDLTAVINWLGYFLLANFSVLE